MAGCCCVYRKVRRGQEDGRHHEPSLRPGQAVARTGHQERPLRPAGLHRRPLHLNCRKFGQWGKFRHEIPDPLLIEGTVHHFDILRALSGGGLQDRFMRSAWNPPWGEYAGDFQALVTMTMTNGVQCFCEGGQANAEPLNGWSNDYFRAECENGTLELDRRWPGAAERWEQVAPRRLAAATQAAWMNSWLAEMFCDWLLANARATPRAAGQHSMRRADLRRRRIGSHRPPGRRPAFLDDASVRGMRPQNAASRRKRFKSRARLSRARRAFSSTSS